MTTIPPDMPAGFDDAVKALRQGGIIAMPTDTLYALVAAAGDEGAVRRVFTTKSRKLANPLPLFVSDVSMAEAIAVFDERARRLAERFWPGALTIVLPRRPSFDSLALAGGETVGMRVPDHPVARAVIEALAQPVTATSANLSGGPDPATAAEVERQIGGAIDYLLDGGECPIGVSSTIVDLTGAEPVILRQGAVSREAIDTAKEA